MFKHRVLLSVAVVVASYVPAASALALSGGQSQRDVAVRGLDGETVVSRTRRVNRLRRLGGLRRRVGDLRGAEKAYRRALAVAERCLPADDLTAARVRNELGVVLKYTGGFDEAALLYEQARAAFVAALGPAHPDVGMVLHNIGGLAHARGRPRDGESAARLAVSIRAAALGDEHPAVAADRAALAGILDAMGRHDDAAQLLQDAITVFERRLGSEHYEVGVTLGSLGAIAAQRGDLRTAERHLRRALAIKERALGASHPELVPTLGTLAWVSRRNGNDRDARELYQRALELLERQRLSKHPHSSVLRANLMRLNAPSRRRRAPTAFAPSPDVSEALTDLIGRGDVAHVTGQQRRKADEQVVDRLKGLEKTWRRTLARATLQDRRRARDPEAAANGLQRSRRPRPWPAGWPGRWRRCPTRCADR